MALQNGFSRLAELIETNRGIMIKKAQDDITQQVYMALQQKLPCQRMIKFYSMFTVDYHNNNS